MKRRPGRCVVDGRPSDGRPYCSPSCFLGLPKLPPRGIDTAIKIDQHGQEYWVR